MVRAFVFALALLPAVVTAQPAALSFESRFAAGSNNGSELAPLPTIGLAPTRPTLPAALAALLTQAVESELRAAPDGASFQLMTRGEGADVRWVFASITRPRAGYAALSPWFEQKLFECVQTLTPDSPELANSLLLISGAPLPDAAARQSALGGAQKLLRAFKEDGCARHTNDSPLIERQRARMASAAQGMLTGEFDAVQFRGQNLVDLIAYLSVLFFDRAGLWAVDRGARLSELLEAALGSGFIASTEAATLVDGEFESFWSWILAVGSSHPGLVPGSLDVIASACAADLPRMRAPFRLRDCVDAGRLTLRLAVLADTSVVVPERGNAP